WTGDSGALGRVELPAETVVAGYTLHPALLDGALHLLAGITGNADADATFLPSGVDSIRVHEPAGAACWVHASVRSGGESADDLTADLRLIDDSGGLVASVDGFRSRRVRGGVAARADPRLLDSVEW